MVKRGSVSAYTRNNWLVDAALFLGAVVAALTGIYFLYLPSGGYRGGTNPFYGITFLFERHTWSEWHTWSGVVMVVAAAIHLAIHKTWVKMMARRVWNAARSGGAGLSRGARVNVALDLAVAVSFFLTAVSGLYFLFVPSSGHGADPGLLFSRTTWDLIHTWAGVVLIASGVAHFYIHWRWVKNVTVKLARGLRPVAGRPAPVQPETA